MSKQPLTKEEQYRRQLGGTNAALRREQQKVKDLEKQINSLKQSFNLTYAAYRQNLLQIRKYCVDDEELLQDVAASNVRLQLALKNLDSFKYLEIPENC